jgi:hypothetical protein
LTQYGEAFSWPARDPAWIRKLLVVGLLSLLPLVGQMNLVGWTLNSLDNLRAERYELAPANLSHVARGARLYLLLLFCGLLLAATAALLSTLTLHVPGLSEVLGVLILAAALLAAAAQPPLWLGVPPAVALARPAETLAAALLFWSGLLIACLGFCVCGLGALFTVPYGYAMVAGVLRVYELELHQRAAPA